MMVGHSRVRSSMKIIKKLGADLLFGSSWAAASRVAFFGDAHFRVSHVSLAVTQKRSADIASANASRPRSDFRAS